MTQKQLLRQNQERTRKTEEILKYWSIQNARFHDPISAKALQDTRELIFALHENIEKIKNPIGEPFKISEKSVEEAELCGVLRPPLQ